jgi:hypothetical protein
MLEVPPPKAPIKISGVLKVVVGVLLLPVALVVLPLACLVERFEHPKSSNNSSHQNDSNQQLKIWRKELSQVCLEFSVSVFSV